MSILLHWKELDLVPDIPVTISKLSCQGWLSSETLTLAPPSCTQKVAFDSRASLDPVIGNHLRPGKVQSCLANPGTPYCKKDSVAARHSCHVPVTPLKIRQL